MVYGGGGSVRHLSKEVVATLRRAKAEAREVDLVRMFAFATGVFREVTEIERLQEGVLTKTGVRLHVLSGLAEASAMAGAFGLEVEERPALLADLGGATLKWVLLRPDAEPLAGCVDLGSIRSHSLFKELEGDPARYLSSSAEHYDRLLADLPGDGPMSLFATGGSAKAICTALQRTSITHADLRWLVERAITHGPPRHFRGSRRAIFTPGALVLLRLLVRCQVEHLVHDGNAVRRRFILRILEALQEHGAGAMRGLVDGRIGVEGNFVSMATPA
jgi:exopolyphosphatase/pppGpp-phosphohydrolase